MSQSATKDDVMIAIMGPTGTGKSAFIRHLTNDAEIRVCHPIDSETSDVRASSYIDAKTGRFIMLVDSPGFDDSREGVTDMDILQMIIDFLELKEREGKKLNGIIYMHRISDPRVGGLVRKNLLMFEAMCGERGLPNVCLVTTYWDREDGKGQEREDELKEGPLKDLLGSGARMHRHLNTPESARAIMAEFIPLPEVTTQIQEEIATRIQGAPPAMSHSAKNGDVMIAIMGPTGTGKSAFIRHLTNDAEIRVGHRIDSETSDVRASSYIDAKTGRSIMLVDSPGFDDSEGITDMDILQKIIDFLELKEREGKKLNGIIYMHRISDPRVGGLTRKNLVMFEAMCGERSLPNVCLVTTRWDHEDGKGEAREDELKEGPFKSLLASGASMHRHRNTPESAQAIIAELIPLPEVTPRIQKEVAEGFPLGETKAGQIIDDEIKVLRKKHENELADLRGLLGKAVRNQELRAKLEGEGKILQEKIMRADEDERRLLMTMPEIHEQQQRVEEAMKRLRVALAKKTAERKKAWFNVKKVEREFVELKQQHDKAERYAKLGIFGKLLGDLADGAKQKSKHF